MTIQRLSCDEQGNDPLVVAYQNAQGDCCARKGISVTWFFLGIIFSLLGAIAIDTSILSGSDAYSNAIFNYRQIFTGLVYGFFACAIISKIISRQTATLQECFYGLATACTLYGVLFAVEHSFPVAAGIATAVICVVYLSAIGFRVLALLLGWFKTKKTVEDVEPLEWPMYTVLVPLYKEKNVANNIIASLHSLDYPRDRLDVKLLLEADDQETLDAIVAANVPSWIETIVVPNAQPRTKPRACNHGLATARGEYLVIFDAEDKPDPQQLKKAVYRFAELNNEKVVCIQAALAYHNYRQNLLTRLFAIEYNMWFTRFQPGLVRLGGPLPLGGTSNHFKIQPLKDVGGWDPYNVTEDCDLGVRLHAHGYTCDLLDSVTWEEANSRVGNWLRQRSRWLKGYMITHVVWFRHPLRLLFNLGPLGFIRFLMVVSSVGILAVFNPILWCILLFWMVSLGLDLQAGYSLVDLLTTRDAIHDRYSWPMLFLDPYEDPVWSMASQILFTLSCILFAANFLFILIACLYGSRKDQHGLFWAAWLSPLYWVLMSIASWKALWQLIVKPHYWEKTVHGLDHGTDAAMALPVPQTIPDSSTETVSDSKPIEDATATPIEDDIEELAESDEPSSETKVDEEGKA